MTIPIVALPDQFNAATAFLDRNLQEGRGSKTAIYYEGQAYTYAQEVMAAASQIPDAQEGMHAFLEKRKPRFQQPTRSTSSPLALK